MNNFRNPRRPLRGQRNSIDGFVSSSGAGTPKRFLRAHRPDGTAANFSRPDGFYSANSQPRDVTVSRPMPKVPTIELEAPKPESKERRFLRRKHKEKKVRSRKAKILRGTGIFSLIIIFAVGGLLGYGYLKARNIFKGDGEGAAALQENVDPVKLRGEGDGRVNILVLGKGGPEQHDGPDLTDTIMLVSIDPVQKETAMLSVPRDFWVKDSSGSQTKINAVYKYAKDRHLASSRQNANDKEGAERAGTKAVMDEVSEVLGIPMHYYVMVDFTAFQKAIDTVGGITIDVKNPVAEQMLLNGKPYYLNVKTGSQTFDGLRALGYARCRHCDNRSDFGRTERQREILIALKDKILTAGTFSNPYKLYQLLSTFGDNVRTDIGGLGEVTRLYDIGKEITSDKIKSYGLADEPNVLVTTGMVNGQSVVMPKAGLYDYSAIHKFVRTNIRDAYLKSEDAKIIVLNGSGKAGLATKTSEELKSYGYNVTRVGDAPTSDYVNTYIVDLTNGVKKYTKSYLEKRLGVTAVNQITDAGIDTTGVDFVIIVGTNEANRQQN